MTSSEAVTDTQLNTWRQLVDRSDMREFMVDIYFSTCVLRLLQLKREILGNSENCVTEWSFNLKIITRSRLAWIWWPNDIFYQLTTPTHLLKVKSKNQSTNINGCLQRFIPVTWTILLNQPHHLCLSVCLCIFVCAPSAKASCMSCNFILGDVVENKCS